jgi:E3 ubiquitin-protein ligase RNF1/2
MVDKVPSSSSSSFNEPKAPKNPFNFTREEYEVLTRNLSTSVPNEHSEYEEIELVEGCTLYDLYRQPRAPMMDPTVKRTFSVRSLNADLLCPICLGIVRDTMVVMECLHRFCRQCIETCLRACKNECPSCRINIPSRRSLRPDHNFDALIRTIYPKLEKFEQDEDQRIAENNRVVHFNNALTKSFKVGLEKQRMVSHDDSYHVCIYL